VTGPAPDLEHGLGRGGEPLHFWAMETGDEIDARVLREATEATGGRRDGVVCSTRRRTPWLERRDGLRSRTRRDPAVLRRHPRGSGKVRLDLRFTFVTDGLTSAIDQARMAAGSKNVSVMAAATVVRQCVDGGLVDELRIHLAPVVLGSGTPLFAVGNHGSSFSARSRCRRGHPLDVRTETADGCFG